MHAHALSLPCKARLLGRPGLWIFIARTRAGKSESQQHGSLAAVTAPYLELGKEAVQVRWLGLGKEVLVVWLGVMDHIGRHALLCQPKV